MLELLPTANMYAVKQACAAGNLKSLFCPVFPCSAVLWYIKAAMGYYSSGAVCYFSITLQHHAHGSIARTMLSRDASYVLVQDSHFPSKGRFLFYIKYNVGTPFYPHSNVLEELVLILF